MNFRKRNDNLEPEENDESPKDVEYASNAGPVRRVSIEPSASQIYFLLFFCIVTWALFTVFFFISLTELGKFQLMSLCGC